MPIQFEATPGNYYVAIRHRNHLGVMSLNPVAFPTTTGSSLYDFSDGFSGDYPTYSLTNVARKKNGQRVNIKTQYRAMWSGNTNPNDGLSGKLVNAIGIGSDYVPILSRLGINGFIDGYYVEDTNIDGRVKYIGPGNDKIPVFVTSISGAIWEQLPENN